MVKSLVTVYAAGVPFLVLKNAHAALRRRYQMKFSRESKPYFVATFFQDAAYEREKKLALFSTFNPFSSSLSVTK